MKRIRQLHLYLGVFFAPSIIFFALTGALQTFSLHESPSAGPAEPLIARMAQIHKKQTLTMRRPLDGGLERRPPGASHGAAGSQEEPPRPPAAGPPGPSPLPLKIFVFLMSLGLVSTTVLGIYMAFKYNRDRRLVWGLLIAGTLLPLVLLFL